MILKLATMRIKREKRNVALRIHLRPVAEIPEHTLLLPFLNHDTPVLTGGEKIMKKMNDAVFYVDMQRPERGKYICTFRLITDKPAEMQENEITTRFFKMLEDTIKRIPDYISGPTTDGRETMSISTNIMSWRTGMS